MRALRSTVRLVAREVNLKTINLNFSETDLFNSVLPYLKWNVFHVTKLTNLESIIQCGEIRPNKEEKFKTSFGSSKNSFFRNRNCVSLFDYRIIETELFEKHAYKCIPTQAASPECAIAVLLTSKHIHSSLLSSKLWHDESAYKEMILPHFEVGHLGPIDLKYITKIIKITVNKAPDSLRVMFLNAAKKSS